MFLLRGESYGEINFHVFAFELELSLQSIPLGYTKLNFDCKTETL